LIEMKRTLIAVRYPLSVIRCAVVRIANAQRTTDNG